MVSMWAAKYSVALQCLAWMRQHRRSDPESAMWMAAWPLDIHCPAVPLVAPSIVILSNSIQVTPEG